MERGSPPVFSNISHVAGDRGWRMPSRWRLFSRYDNYTRHDGHSGGSPGNWGSTAGRWHDTYDRHLRTQMQPFRPPAFWQRAVQMQPLFRPSRLRQWARRLVAMLRM